MANKIKTHPCMTIEQASDVIIETIKSPDCDNEDIKDAIIVLAEMFKGISKRSKFNSYF